MLRSTTRFPQYLGSIRARGKLAPQARTLAMASVSSPADAATAPRPQVVDMRNGDKVPGPFTPGEYDRRVGHASRVMDDLELDGMVLTSIHNVTYHSGFTYCAFGRNYALCLSPDGTPTTVSAGIDGGQPHRRGHGDNITYTDWEKGNFFSAVGHGLGLGRGGATSGTASAPLRVGVEMDHITPKTLGALETSLSEACLGRAVSFVDVGDPLMCGRLVKSEEEIRLITDSARIADLGGAAVVEAIAEGAPEHEIALHSTRTMIRAIADAYPGSEIMDTWTWFQSGINTDGAHNPVTTRRLEKGDILSLNCFPMISGYYTALERTLFLDHVPSEAHRRAWEVNVAVHERGLELIQPGARCSDIASELNDLYEQLGGYLEYRSFGYGHSFGALCHYYGREAGLELREDIHTVLEPGMVVSMEPMIMIPEGTAGAGGYREHDILVVHEDGAENITGFPYGPEHNIVKA